jgi:hypothetical protein
MSNDKEPLRPQPSSGTTTGIPWDKLSDKEFQEKECEMLENIRSRSNGDFTI